MKFRQYFTNFKSLFLSQTSFRQFLTISAFVFMLIPNIVSCKPSTHRSNKFQSIGFQKAFAFDTNDTDKKYEACWNDIDLNELCERCTRITEVQDGDVFAMCCSDEDNAQEFCRNYVFFGIT